MAVSDSGPARRRRFLVGGVVGAACLCAAVAAISVRSAPFEALAAGPTAKYGLRQPAERRAADGRLETRLRVVVGRDAYGVLARRYEGGTPGPTLRVSPGDRVAITVENRLGPERSSDRARDPDALHSPNTTTLHAHGLHVSPAQDDVFTLVPPGASKTYVYEVPEDHARGTFWYHPHARGSSGLQAAMMHGALVVEEADPVDDVVLLLGQYNLVAGKPRNYAWASYASRSRVPVVAGVADGGGSPDDRAAALKAALEAPLDAPFVTVNGERSAEYGPPAGRAVRWRLINAATNDVLALYLEDPSACETRVVARDGVALAAPRSAPLAKAAPLVLAPGSRADVDARCASPTTLKSGRTDALDAFLGAGSDVFAGDIMRIAPTSDASPEKSDDGDRPPSLPSRAALGDLRGAKPDRVALLEMVERPAKVTRNGDQYTPYGLAVTAGDGGVSVGDVVEWTIRNDRVGAGPQTTTHPFHVHTNHFQIIRATSDAYDFAVGEWRDTIVLPSPGNVTVRFRAADFSGKSVAHCHIFAHADTGMNYDFTIAP